MASERILAHFISGPQADTYDATTVLLSVFEGKCPTAKVSIRNAVIVEILAATVAGSRVNRVFPKR
jgi:hypothetical protein